MAFSDKMKAQEEEAKKDGYASKGGGDWYKFAEGANAFRVLTEPEMIFEDFKNGICYTGCGFEGSPKFMAYVLDRKDGSIKIAKLPYGIGSKIASYENDKEFNLDFTTFPMPYDIRVTAVGAGTKEVKYQTDANPNKRPVELSVLDELAKLNPIPNIINKMKEKNKKEKGQPEAAGNGEYGGVSYPNDIDPADIPF